ncbi:long-chain fatty acid--CoA ligase [Thalassococcus sp. S3]|nr:long-chain fatty acid--CoA ligase [Thalassococcus sp. S3]
MTLDDAVHHVTTTNPTFAIEPALINGVEFKVFKNVPTNLRQLLQASRAQHGDGSLEYLVYEDERWTYDAFCNDVKAVAKSLQALGVVKGDRIAIAMRNYPELLVATLATASLGAVTVLLNAWWTSEELDYALTDSTPKLVFADGPRAERLRACPSLQNSQIIGVRDGVQHSEKAYENILRNGADADWPETEISPDDDFAIMYSSGTTGHPKGVVQTHRGAINAVFSWLLQAVIAPLMNPPDPGAPEPQRPSALVVTPLFHVTATHPLFLLSLPAGAKLALMHKWDAEAAVRLIRDEHISRFLGVPTQSADLMEAARRMGETLPTLDYLGAGGAKRPAAQVEELAKVFPNADVATGWGMTETNALGIGMLGDDYIKQPGAAGRLHPPLQEVRFLDEDGRDVTVGDIGELTVKSPANMRCYLNKPEATAEVLQDGWLRTGDLGFIDEEGVITIVDRRKNIIIRGGENIACLDVEGALHRHPAVAEACAFSVPDDRLGEIVGAGVQLRAGHEASADDLRAYLADHIAKFKIPEHLWLQADPLPRGATDKIDRRALREACLATLAPVA